MNIERKVNMRYNNHDAHDVEGYEPFELETNQKPLDPYKQIRISGVSANKNCKHRLRSNCCVFYRYFFICYCIVKTLIIFHVNLILQQILSDYKKIVINNPYKKLLLFVIQCIRRNYYNACIYQSNNVSTSPVLIACCRSKLEWEKISEKVVPIVSSQSKLKRTLTTFRTAWIILFLSLKFKLKKCSEKIIQKIFIEKLVHNDDKSCNVQKKSSLSKFKLILLTLKTSWAFLYPTCKYISKKFRDNIVQTNNLCKNIVRNPSYKSKRILALSTPKRSLALSTSKQSLVLSTSKRNLALSTSKRNLALSTLGASWAILTLGQASAVVIPPPWANVSLNPCAKNSWQQILWPNHSKCYKIFSQGPCSDGEEIYFDTKKQSAGCRCQRGSLRHGGECHKLHTRGPCNHREYLGKSKRKGTKCIAFQQCQDDEAFWPREAKCYKQYTKGPCQHGDLFSVNPKTGWPECGCDSGRMRTQYWPHTRTCHELHTRGPCVTGHVFIYDALIGSTACDCHAHMSTYHPSTRQCHQLGTRGPCNAGYIFTPVQHISNPVGVQGQCKCLPGHLIDVEKGTCQRAYTRAKCTVGHFFVPSRGSPKVGECQPVPCKKPGELYSPDTEKCYPVGSSGPCPMGALWVYERASSLQGKCKCSKGSVGYWPPHNACYAQGEKGPCPKNHVVSYRGNNMGLACSCDKRKGFLRWKGKCQKVTAQDLIFDLIGSMDDFDADRSQVYGRAGRQRSLKMGNKKSEQISPTNPTLMSHKNLVQRNQTNINDLGHSFTPTLVNARISISSDSARNMSSLPTSGFGKILKSRRPTLTITRMSNKLIKKVEHASESNENDMMKRVSRLTHQGLITRRKMPIHTLE